MQWWLDVACPIVERRSTIQLRRRHPEFLLVVNPHSVDPKQSRVLNQQGHCAIGEDADDALAVGITDVDIAVRVDSCTPCRRRVSIRLPVLAEDLSQSRVIECLIQVSRLDSAESAIGRLVVKPFAVRTDFEMIGVDTLEAPVRGPEKITFGRDRHVRIGAGIVNEDSARVSRLEIEDDQGWCASIREICEPSVGIEADVVEQAVVQRGVAHRIDSRDLIRCDIDDNKLRPIRQDHRLPETRRAHVDDPKITIRSHTLGVGAD